ncbi:MAG: replicative DNA helicase [Deltaproteobacteria bacterium]|nr:MAG: replicative DNA helicase [Deltaproteobacteria bacterium]RLB02504.1 MAG: replicative DNA helicase [Deltaproteobacteria bacterium]
MAGEVPSPKVPPHSLEAEQSVLGGIIIDNEAMNRVLELLRPGDFYKEAHQRIFGAMISLFERGEPLDLITLTNELKRSKDLERIGGATYLAQLADAVPTAANIAYYAKIVKEKALLRRLIAAATDIVTECYREGQDIEELLDQAEQAIFSISQFRVRPAFFPIKEVLKEAFRSIERLYEKKELITGVPSGFKDLDRKTAGFQPSDLIIVAGRPSMGKTAFCLNIAQYAAVEAKVPTAIFSMEMSKEQLALRMLCSEAKVSASKVRSGFLSEGDLQKLTMAASTLADAPIVIDDTPALSVLELRAKARRLKGETGLGLIIIDYLQLMRGRSSAERREQEISEISRSLKALAKELSIPVIAISQLSRRAEDRPGRRPQLADLRESGAIEQDADLIIFLYRDEVYNPHSDKKGIAEVIIGKQRNGPTGTVELSFIPELTTFRDLYRGDYEG